MALLSGILFAFGAMRVRQAPETSVFEQILALFLCGLLAALALSLFPLAVLGRPPSLKQLITVAPWLVLVTVGFLIPVMWGGLLGFPPRRPWSIGLRSIACYRIWWSSSDAQY